ncbi:Cro/CI family transcriptional regulator [Sodalis ligni]|uniref:Cro protein n=1 Tax=Sodalis ligni TaxID=2697027 RepID=A0A4R1NLL5_9GAMM|nr:Cro protein [Sodalis ligni]
MKRISLAEYVADYGQVNAAAALGVYQSAISKAIASGRNVTVIINDKGDVYAEELRPFPSQKRLENNTTNCCDRQ